MKVLVAYISLTGNTQKIAEAIFQEIQAEKDIKVLDEVTDVSAYDLIFVGFPIHGFGQPAEEARNFLAKHGYGRKVALFITHSAPEDSPYVTPWLEACREAAKETMLLGLSDFQGQVALNQVDLMLQSSEPEALEIARNVVHSSLGQPDASRLNRARAFAGEVVAKLESEGAWYKNLLFKDQSFVFEFLRVIAKSLEHGADIGECLETAYRIKQKEGDLKAQLQSWYEEWRTIAMRIEKIGDECFAKGHKVSARDAYLRASEYYRSADFYLHDNLANPAIMELWRKARHCFDRGRELADPAFEAVHIPYEDTKLPAYFCPAYRDGRPSPTLVIHSGFDGTIEEIYMEYASDAFRRGYNCLIFEGPGHGSMIREQGIAFRPDWEAAVTPVIDYAMQRKDVDPARMALMGLSMGGYLAPRAAAYEHRLAACIANAGIFDMFENNAKAAGMSREDFKGWLHESPHEFDQLARAVGEKNIQVYWEITHGMWVFKVNSPHEYVLKLKDYHLRDCAHLISCPTLVIDSEAEQFFAGQAKQLFDALMCPKTYLLFKAKEGAELHCQVGGHLLGNQKIFDWLDETLGVMG